MKISDLDYIIDNFIQIGKQKVRVNYCKPRVKNGVAGYDLIQDAFCSVWIDSPTLAAIIQEEKQKG